MKFKRGADVYTAVGKKLGSISNVVIDPATKAVTHIIIQEGFIFKEDKVVGVELVARADEDQVTLKEGITEDSLFPRFTAEHFVHYPEELLEEGRVEEVHPEPLFWYPPLGAAGGYMGYPFLTGIPRGAPEQIIEENLPSDTLTLEKNARVFSRDGEHVGNIEEVYTDSQTHRISHILMSKGFIDKEHKLIPVNWIEEVMEDEIWLNVDARFLAGIVAYSR